MTKPAHFAALAALAAAVLYLNYYAEGMQGILKNYADFRRIVTGGFDPTLALHGAPTFPMWGYGWLFIVTEHKLPLLVFQLALAFVSAALFVKQMPSPRVTDMMLFVVALPWLAVQSLEGPYGIAASLWVIAIALLVRPTVPHCLSAGALAGLALNFRSDWILVPILISLLLLWAMKMSHQAVACAGAWLGAAAMMLLPWAIYTHHATGHYLLTSTNAGHVLFLGLGDLPGNRWGITQHDEDPVMRSIVEKSLGTHAPSTTYKAHRILVAAFEERVAADPREYAHKLFYSAARTALVGAYPGEFYDTPECQPDCRTGALRFLTGDKWPGLHMACRASIWWVSQVASMVPIIVSFMAFPITAMFAIRTRSLLPAMLVVCICYQFALQIAGTSNLIYTSNALLLHAGNLTYGYTWLHSRAAAARV